MNRRSYVNFIASMAKVIANQLKVKDKRLDKRPSAKSLRSKEEVLKLKEAAHYKREEKGRRRLASYKTCLKHNPCLSR